MPHRTERRGYARCRNPDADDGLWVINGRRRTLYARADLSPEQQLQAVRVFVGTTRQAAAE
jgi:hypothetical protein